MSNNPGDLFRFTFEVVQSASAYRTMYLLRCSPGAALQVTFKHEVENFYLNDAAAWELARAAKYELAQAMIDRIIQWRDMEPVVKRTDGAPVLRGGMSYLEPFKY